MGLGSLLSTLSFFEIMDRVSMNIKKTLAPFIKGALPIIGIGCIVALGIYLTATANPPQKGKTVIRWVVDPNPIRPTTIALFEKENPDIHVINDPDTGAQNERLLTQIAGNVAPDVMSISTPDLLYKLAKDGLLLDIRPYVRKYHIPVETLCLL